MPPVSQNAPATATPATTPLAETAAATAETPVPGTSAAARDTGSPTAPQLTMVSGDPLQDLRNAVGEADDALRQAIATVRSLRDKVRAVERFIRDREKLYAKSEKVLDQLKLVAGF